MLFNNIDKSTKIEILEENIPKYEKDVYGLLVGLGINPVTFDQDSFEEEDPLADPNELGTKALRKRLKIALDALTLINKQILDLEI